MKKILFLLLTVFTVSAACSHTPKSSVEAVQAEESKVIHLTEAEFLQKVYDYKKNLDEWVFAGDKPAIVDFYATWCGPCRQVAPVLEELAKEYDGKIVIYKIDTDKEQGLAAAFGIRSIPTILFIPRQGKPQVAQGALPKEELKKVIDEFLLDSK